MLLLGVVAGGVAPWLELREEEEMTVAGRATWKAVSEDAALSSSRAMFSRDRDFIMDSSERVFFGSFDNGDS